MFEWIFQVIVYAISAGSSESALDQRDCRESTQVHYLTAEVSCTTLDVCPGDGNKCEVLEWTQSDGLGGTYTYRSCSCPSEEISVDDLCVIAAQSHTPADGQQTAFWHFCPSATNVCAGIANCEYVAPTGTWLSCHCGN